MMLITQCWDGCATSYCRLHAARAAPRAGLPPRALNRPTCLHTTSMCTSTPCDPACKRRTQHSPLISLYRYKHTIVQHWAPCREQGTPGGAPWPTCQGTNLPTRYTSKLLPMPCTGAGTKGVAVVWGTEQYRRGGDTTTRDTTYTHTPHLALQTHLLNPGCSLQPAGLW
jgi:hypothetical protein